VGIVSLAAWWRRAATEDISDSISSTFDNGGDRKGER